MQFPNQYISPVSCGPPAQVKEPTLAYLPRSYLGNPSPKLSTNVLRDDIRLDISVMDVDDGSSKDCSIPDFKP